MASAASVTSDSVEDPTSQPSSQSSNQPRLSLQIDTPPSSSPFPSPSSSFLPPPMPGAHEFAVKPPPQGKTKRGSRADLALGASSVIANGGGEDKQKENGLSRADLGELRALSPATPTNKSTFLIAAAERTSSPLSSSPADAFPNSPLATPTPITPAPNTNTNSTASAKRSSYESSHPNPHRISNPILQSTRDSNPNPSPNPSNQRPESTSSLTSTRPAPPSPAMSRRASGAPSTTSNRSRSSRPSSTSTSQLPGTLSRNPSTRKSSRLSQSLPISPQQSSPQQQQQRQETQQKKRRSLLVKIKDFAFASTDDRHAGLGADVPKPNRVRVLNRFHRSRTASNGSHLSVSSIGTEEDEDGDGEDEHGEGLGDDGWGGFKWGFGRFSSWGFGRGSTGGKGDNSGEGSSSSSASFPSKTDFARNFGEEAEEPDTYADDDEDEDDEDEGEYYDLGCGGSPHAPEEEEPLYPGLYRALYAFEPEGTAEMKLEEDQVVKVIGRGGGVGWAVVDRGGAGGHALVPESYLEVVRLDDDVVGGGDAGA